MSIQYLKGDLFENIPHGSDRLTLIPQVVNNQGFFGSGFAAATKKHFPRVAEVYTDWARNLREIEEDEYLQNSHCPASLGDVQFVSPQRTLQGLWFANMMAQEGLVSPRNPRPLKYNRLVHCMETVLDFLREPTVNDPQIYAPQFGAGLADGKWLFIEKLIEDIWISGGIPVTIFCL